MYRRIILKLSGETLAPTDRAAGAFDAERAYKAARMIADLKKRGIQTGVVLGGGNIWRGRFSEDMEPTAADQMGMLATVLNALCLKDALRRAGCKADVFTAQEMTRFARLYTRDAADEALNTDKIALLAGGTGNPFFTTDTGAALRAAELGADAVFKGTTVDGVYDKDPRKHPDAKLIRDITYQEAVERQLGVMDMTAFILCQSRHVPEIRVFNMDDLQNVLRAADGEAIGTRVHE